MRWVRWAALATIAGALLTTPLWAPTLLREASYFQVRQVEVAGNRFLPPHDVLDGSGIQLGQNVWDDAEDWETLLRAHPGIQDARVTRRLPGTLRIRIVEKQPVAYVTAETLIPVTAAGEPFPIDPSRAPLDLPIVRGNWPDSAASGPTRALLRDVGLLAELDPGLLAETSEIGRSATGEALVLSHRVGEIVLPSSPSATRLAELHAVLLELERQASESPAEARRARVDARFAAQIVVRFLSSV